MERREVERQVRRLMETGDADAAATLAIRAYGPEILGFLVAVQRNEHDAAEAFADLSLDLWRDLPSFRWECSLRTWAYTMARHRLLAYRRTQERTTSRTTPLTPRLVDAAVQGVRTTTASYLRTDVRDAVARLREDLEPDDQTLLILRIDRRLAWREVAHVMGVAEPTLRKRFERIKARLREKAKEYGIGR